MNENLKKDEIKNAARQLFIRFGYNKTSMNDIAKQSGLAKPTVYYYYQNKESIFKEVVIDEAQSFMDEVDAELSKFNSIEGKVSHLLKIIYEGLKKYSAEMKELPEIMCHFSPHGEPIVDGINNLFIAKLRPLLQAAKNEGSFDYEDDEITLQALSYMTDFLNLDWMRKRPESEQDKLIEKVIKIILNGLKRRQ